MDHLFMYMKEYSTYSYIIVVRINENTYGNKKGDRHTLCFFKWKQVIERGKGILNNLRHFNGLTLLKNNIVLIVIWVSYMNNMKILWR